MPVEKTSFVFPRVVDDIAIGAIARKTANSLCRQVLMPTVGHEAFFFVRVWPQTCVDTKVGAAKQNVAGIRTLPSKENASVVS